LARLFGLQVQLDWVMKDKGNLWWENLWLNWSSVNPSARSSFCAEQCIASDVFLGFRFVNVPMLLQSPPGGGGRVYRTRSTSTHQHLSQSHPNGNGEGLGKRFGSEPDLRVPHSNHIDSPAKQRISRYGS